MSRLKNGNVRTVEKRPVRRPALDRPRRRESDEELRHELAAARQPEAAALAELDEVVREPDDAEADESSETDPDEPVVQVHPEERRGDDSEAE